MIWLAWRQFRAQAAVAGAAIAAFALLLALTGPQLAHDYHTQGRNFLNDVSGVDTDLYLIGVLAVLALPALIGMFWGAPLLTRELDAGTHRLVWTQTTRARWLAAKLALTGLVAVAAAGLLSLAVTWWSSPVDAAIGAMKGLPGPGLLIFPRLSREVFASRGIAPLGYAAFMFVLGLTAGALIRRTLPAMAAVLVAFIAVQVFVSTSVRPALLTPDRVTTTVSAANMMSLDALGNLTVTIGKPGAWVTSEQTVNRAGQAVGLPEWMSNCLLKAAAGRVRRNCFARFAQRGYRQQINYQPAARFWPLQWAETAIYLALAVLLAGVCMGRTRRLS